MSGLKPHGVPEQRCVGSTLLWQFPVAHGGLGFRIGMCCPVEPIAQSVRLNPKRLNESEMRRTWRFWPRRGQDMQFKKKKVNISL